MQPVSALSVDWKVFNTIRTANRSFRSVLFQKVLSSQKTNKKWYQFDNTIAINAIRYQSKQGICYIFIISEK